MAKVTLRRLIASIAGLSLIGGGIVLPTVAQADDAAATPVVTVTKAPRAGGEVTITGSKFSTTGPGVYVAVAPSTVPEFYGHSDQFVGAKPGGDMTQSGAIWVASPAMAALADKAPGVAKMSNDGSFTIKMRVPAFEEGKTYVVLTTLAHGQGKTNKSQDTRTTIEYESATTPVTPTPQPPAPDPAPQPPAPAPADKPEITLSEVPAAGGTVTVTGKNFPAEGTGVYVSLAKEGQTDFYAAAGAKALVGEAVWVKPFKMVRPSAPGGKPGTPGAPGNGDPRAAAAHGAPAGAPAAPGGRPAAGPSVQMDEHGNFTLTLQVPAESEGKLVVLTSLAHGVGVKDKSANTVTPVVYAAAPSAPATPAPAEPTKAPKCEVNPNKTRVTGGSLNWGLRESFTTYIRSSIAKGTWETSGGVSWTGSAFKFAATAGLYDLGTKSGTIHYSGTVHFTGHGGLLDMTISNPSIVINGSNAQIYMTVASSDMSGKHTNYGRVHFANAVVSGVAAEGSSLSFKGGSVKLTAEGAKAFAGFYNAGEPLDSFSSAVSLAPAEACDPNTGELVVYNAYGKKMLASTGVSVESTALLAFMLFLMGTGLVVARRRTAA